MSDFYRFYLCWRGPTGLRGSSETAMAVPSKRRQGGITSRLRPRWAGVLYSGDVGVAVALWKIE